MHVHAKCQYCIDITPWGPCIAIDHTECDNPVTFSGQIYAVTSADAGRRGNMIDRFKPWNITTTTHIVSPISSSGCNRDWVPFDTDIQSDINGAVIDGMKEYVQQYQEDLGLEQPINITDDGTVVMYYNITSMSFNTSDSIHILMDAYINSTFDNGTTVMYAQHRNASQLLPDSWTRYTDNNDLVTLAGMRVSPEILANLFQALADKGVLDPKSNSTLYDATLFFNMTMSEPTVLIPSNTSSTPYSNAGADAAGCVLRESTLQLEMKCKEPRSDTGERYQLLYAELQNVTEQLDLLVNDSMYVVMQLRNVSTAKANVTIAKSDALMIQKDQIRKIAQLAVNKSLPSVNHQLKQYPLRMPGWLIPFAPHPVVKTVASNNGTQGYLDVQWSCSCNKDNTQWAQCYPGGDVTTEITSAIHFMEAILSTLQCKVFGGQPCDDATFAKDKLQLALESYRPSLACPPHADRVTTSSSSVGKTAFLSRRFRGRPDGRGSYQYHDRNQPTLDFIDEDYIARRSRQYQTVVQSNAVKKLASEAPAPFKTPPFYSITYFADSGCTAGEPGDNIYNLRNIHPGCNAEPGRHAWIEPDPYMMNVSVEENGSLRLSRDCNSDCSKCDDAVEVRLNSCTTAGTIYGSFNHLIVSEFNKDKDPAPCEGGTQPVNTSDVFLQLKAQPNCTYPGSTSLGSASNLTQYT